MENSDPQLTIFYDGACPLCSSEINYYQGQHGSSSLAFVDVTTCSTAPRPDLTREAALRRLHVARSDGTLVSGARAFVSIWQALPGLRWLARLAALPGMIHLLEFGYRLILPIRPRLAQIWRRLHER